jgi:hypothetical protein
MCTVLGKLQQHCTVHRAVGRSENLEGVVIWWARPATLIGIGLNMKPAHGQNCLFATLPYVAYVAYFGYFSTAI